jgi:hypothetical protein
MKHTGIKDTYGTELKLGDTVEMTFNKGTFNEHKALFEIVWERGAFQYQRGGKMFPMCSVAESVVIEKQLTNGTPIEIGRTFSFLGVVSE